MADDINSGGVPTTSSSAKETIRALLASYGLESLTDWYWDKVVAGEPDAQIMLELRQTQEYKTRFPGMAELSAKGRAISEGEYVSMERGYAQLFREYGLPEGFYDSPDDFAKFIANEVSADEMGARLDVARTAVYDTPPEVRDQLARLYNVDAGGIMAYLLDPTKALPIIQQQFTAATAAAASKLSGYGLLTQGEAESLATAGKSFDQFAQGFDFLANAKELYQPIIGETNADVISREEQLGAAFSGNTAAARRLERRARERAAQFQGGGGYATTQGGVTGLGSASA